MREWLSGTGAGAVPKESLILVRLGSRILRDDVDSGSAFTTGALVGDPVLAAGMGVVGFAVGRGQYGVGRNTFGSAPARGWDEDDCVVSEAILSFPGVSLSEWFVDLARGLTKAGDCLPLGGCRNLLGRVKTEDGSGCETAVTEDKLSGFVPYTAPLG